MTVLLGGLQQAQRKWPYSSVFSSSVIKRHPFVQRKKQKLVDRVLPSVSYGQKRNKWCSVFLRGLLFPVGVHRRASGYAPKAPEGISWLSETARAGRRKHIPLHCLCTLLSIAHACTSCYVSSCLHWRSHNRQRAFLHCLFLDRCFVLFSLFAGPIRIFCIRVPAKVLSMDDPFFWFRLHVNFSMCHRRYVLFVYVKHKKERKKHRQRGFHKNKQEVYESLRCLIGVMR